MNSVPIWVILFLILEGIAIVVLTLIGLSILRLVAALSQRVEHVEEPDHRDPSIPSLLRGVNISNELVRNIRTDEVVTFSSLARGEQTFLFLSDPTCAKCEARLEELLLADWLGTGQLIVAVRGSERTLSAYASEIPKSIAVVGDNSGLHLGRMSAPFGAVVSSAGGYVLAAPLEGDPSIRQLRSAFESTRDRSLAGASAAVGKEEPTVA